MSSIDTGLSQVWTVLLPTWYMSLATQHRYNSMMACKGFKSICMFLFNIQLVDPGLKTLIFSLKGWINLIISWSLHIGNIICYLWALLVTGRPGNRSHNHLFLFFVKPWFLKRSVNFNQFESLMSLWAYLDHFNGALLQLVTRYF